MRLIDAEAADLQCELFTYIRYTGIDEAPYEDATKAIDEAPTVDAIPRERIEQMVEEIKALSTWSRSLGSVAIPYYRVEEIIHKYTNASENSGQYDTFTKEQNTDPLAQSVVNYCRKIVEDYERGNDHG